MNEIGTQPNEGAEPPLPRSGMAQFLWQQLPYIVALVLAIAGVAYTNVSHQPLVGYWEFLALAICVVCIVTKWPETEGREAQLRLIWTQALHWIAVLVTMNIMLVSGVQQLLPTPATGLVLLTLLALGTFLAGISLLSLQISFLGLAMGVAVPAISWLKQSVFFFLLGAVLLIGLGITFWLRQERPPRVSPSDTNSQVEA
ncbi:hypothetical protein [Bradyrhizobium sp. WSM3983]|uniref:hypothetical protein n=1 Tax=Bradyrhizobium sp. WSM3983 TaxID=1038867 RepID=UPI00042950CF|nr:hypothetical protein [Bradyrhizobium sp. WSM3983]